ncbi:membrane-bound O-acyltransferase domain-containing protein 2-like [Tropilaelaps mercedesae]|uniref:Membrane-bound O-acyltransferase domain-containing protein 2-like n=1 Tax=Tropilaelaps mercedesae TaxID=418985 RepID=A0A1V9X4T4_9ACAR|nr:membrane-bound O-acyltransferase domain-containing protein 2-like [Tropilaelaps mercedesae]
MSHWVVRDGWYQGSQLLQPVASLVGVQLDKLNYIAAGFGCILLGSFYRIVLHPSRATPVARQLYTIVVGMLILYFCFGTDTKHMFYQTTLSYLLMVFCPMETLPKATLFVNLGYQSVMHALRMYYDYEGYTLDITGALMMLTQRLTSLAFSLRDGQQPEKCTPYMLKQAIKSKPAPISYFAYGFEFHQILCGPLIPFHEFEAVTNGTIFTERQRAAKERGDCDSKQTPNADPSPTRYVLERSFYCLLCIFVVVFVVPIFRIEFLFSDEFRNSLIPVKLFWLFVYTALTRQQYYVIWKMAEAICNSSNFGYRYVNGEDRWDGCTNVDIWGVETAVSQRDGLAAWNKSTQRWLRNICYDRVATSKTLMTFFLSAAWHGFYPGYYLTFMTLAVQTLAARSVRRSIRPFFQGSSIRRLAWDVITFAATLTGFAYATIPFILLSFDKAISMWSEVYFYGHVFSVLAIFVLPRVIAPTREDKLSPKFSELNHTSSAIDKSDKVGLVGGPTSTAVDTEIKRG